jgi:hypothetical protein
LSKKKKDIRRAGIGFSFMFVVIFGFAIYCAYISLLMGFLLFSAVSAPFGIFGIGSLLKPDKFGEYALKFDKFLERGLGSEARSDSHNKQTQKETSQSVQIMGNAHNITYQNMEGKTTRKGGKIFCCPNGHPYEAYPPDDHHPKASLEKEFAKRNASGTIISRHYTCEECGSESVLYWYFSKPAIL